MVEIRFFISVYGVLVESDEMENFVYPTNKYFARRRYYLCKEMPSPTV